MKESTSSAPGDRLLRTDEVAAWLSVSKSTLVRWRQAGEGPAVYWLAEGVPRYRAADVEVWLAARTAASTRAPRRGSAHARTSR
ncbi:helix-turn-helix transcriptional regulator [Microbacterium sp.]|uniref:helix-turn-helix transcriptional regulator n=1 Tax=Microbacterium sp. TaxID=51671 RepID=UPI0039E32BA5